MIHPKRYVDFYSRQDIDVRKTVDSHFEGFNGELRFIPFDNKVADTANRFDGINWTANRIMRVDINVHFPQIHIARPHAGSDSDKGYYFKIMVRAASDGTVRALYEPPQSIAFGGSDLDEQWYGFNMSLTGVPLNPGDQIFIACEAAGHNTVIVTDIYQGAILTIKENTQNVLYGESLQLEGTLPDITTTDFLKFIAFMFCAIIQTDNTRKTVTIVPFGHIIQNLPYAIDWSSKITNTAEDYDVQIGNYCQHNEAKWNHDDTVSPDTYANGSFTITDYNLDLYQDIYDIPFAASYETLVMGNFRTAFINKIPNFNTVGDNGLEFSTNTQQRILLLNKRNATFNYRWDHTFTTITDNVPFTYFASADNTPDLTLPSIFKNHYTDLINVLNDQRKLTCYLMLTEMDIQQLDFFKPVYIQKYASYFYISKITDFTGLKPCKVELIRL